MRLQEQFRQVCRMKGFSHRTVKSYWYWIKDFLRYYQFRHPSQLNSQHIERYLSYLAEQRQCAIATQNASFNALRFLYIEVLKLSFENISAVRSQRAPRIPEVFSPKEAYKVLTEMHHPFRLMGMLMYGSGLRLSEVYRLRVKDVLFDQSQLVIREAKGRKERITFLPETSRKALQHQISVAEQYFNIAVSHPSCEGLTTMPLGLMKKYPTQARSFHWQYIFPSTRLCRVPDTKWLARHHIHETTIQRAFRKAIAVAGIRKKASSHTFRHSFATELIKKGADITQVQHLLGHNDIRTTQIYLHVAGSITERVKSPLDVLINTQN